MKAAADPSRGGSLGEESSTADSVPDTAAGKSQRTPDQSRPLRVLVIGMAYAPELAGNAPYTAGVAEHYAEIGHHVRVITGVPHYPEWSRRPSPPKVPGANPTVDRYQHFVPRRPSAVGRLAYEMSWFLSASRVLPALKCDAVIGVTPSLSGAALAWLAGKKAGAPVGLVFQDLLGPAASESGFKGGRKFAGLARLVESFLATRADRVAIVSEGFRPYLRKSGVDDLHIQRVRNWMRPTSAIESREVTRARLGWKSADFVCVLAGNMGQKQGLSTVLEAARLLTDNTIKIVFAGGGNDRERLEAEAERQGLEAVSFLGVQAPGEYEAMLQAADVLILSQRAAVGQMCLPGRLTSYFASGRPVVAAVDPSCDAALEVEAAEAGVVVTPGDPAALARSLLSLKAAAESDRPFVSRGTDYAKHHLSREAALAAYDIFLESLIRKTRRGLSGRG